MLDETIEHLPDIERFRPVINQRDIGNSECVLQSRVTVQLIQYDFAVGVSFELHDNPHAMAVRFVPDIGNFRYCAAMDTSCYFRDNCGLDNHIRYLGYYYTFPAPLGRFDIYFSSDFQMSPAPHISIQNALSATNDSARGKVRPRQTPDNILESAFWVFDDQQQGVTNLTDIMRRDVGRHTNGNSGRAVDQQIREFRGQYRRLITCLVVVGHKIHCIVINIFEYLHGRRSHSRLGISHSGRRVGIDTAEVTLRVNERIPHTPFLAQPHECVVDSLVAVRMVVAPGIADDFGAFAVLASRPKIQIVHRGQYSSLRWF